MLLTQSDNVGFIVDHFDDLTGYEKGALARALIRSLVKQGSLEIDPDRETSGRISFSIEQWQLRLLARLNGDYDVVEDEDDDCNEEILLVNLCLGS